MTYNFGIIMSVLLGNAVGFFIFGFGDFLGNKSRTNQVIEHSSSQ